MTRILLVEDNELNRDMLARRLARAGFGVEQAVDGTEGIHAARNAAPDLILLDIRLPDIDGREVARRLKADPATRTIPIIALTASIAEADRAKALESGCDDFDVKPVDMQRLIRKIQALLPS